MDKISFLFFVALTFLSISCNSVVEEKEEALDSTVVQGNLIILHDDVLESMVKDLAKQFEEQYPHVKVINEAGGSRKFAQEIINHRKSCDILISSDYKLIQNMLIPAYAKWLMKFANDEIVIAYGAKSKFADSLRTDNWFRILLSKQVQFGRTDPDFAPVGYRSVLCIKLAEKYYGEEGIRDQLLFKDKKFIKPSESQLITMLRKNMIDYFFTYKSTAEQKHLKYVLLPDQINLKSKDYSAYYSMAKMKVSGREPGEYIVHQGAPIRFGICPMIRSTNLLATEAFLSFMIERIKSSKILTKNNIQNTDTLEFVPIDSVPEFLIEETE